MVYVHTLKSQKGEETPSPEVEAQDSMPCTAPELDPGSVRTHDILSCNQHACLA